jgi:molybdenum cofactor cytidylyltransferase
VEQSLKTEVDCIIPAAGLSARMGSWKLMLPYQGKTIVEHSVANALKFCSRVLLVTGYRGDELKALFSGQSRVDLVSNLQYEDGMVSSIKKGVEQVKTEYFFITHADMPCIEPEIFSGLWQARYYGAVFPGTEGRAGHPVLLSGAIKEAILMDTESPSVKKILEGFKHKYLGLENPSICFDVDTVQGYRELLGC